MTLSFDETVMAVFNRAVLPALEQDDLTIGEDISPFPSIKIAFEGYAEDDDGDDDYESLSFMMYVHKDSNKKGFKFPQHEETSWGIILSRDEEEVSICGWFNSAIGDWEVILDPDIDPATGMTIEGIKETLSRLI